ncbi:SDR family NAD(P)-dependent oxidoreductase [uncultured Sulfitobacter sp.]|uniref:SDR family NAD(P)-dependent oxidoreductase n=1 Tax=uncultured Sulfitobacter sp. TaxID=191468 RepID=UPI00262A584C|nr:SDR family NAD(P)-dependent oxidoreductase [uncultured Sulfitobacter sp.]
MTEPLAPPPKKNPQKRTPTPLLPPATRSRAALGLGAMAAQGRFGLQVCAECQAVQYPPRDACVKCLSHDLAWQDVDPSGRLMAETTIRVSPEPYFRERMPWRMGAVKLDAGPMLNCHLHGEVARGDSVRMALKLDRAGQGVLVALPLEGSDVMQDDPVLRAMSCDPKHRRVLISDARSPVALALAEALLAAGAAHVFAGEPEAWRHWPARAAFEAMEDVSLLPLDVTDVSSVQKLSAEIGGKVDILINTARFTRPGGVLGNDTTFARDAMEVNTLGLMRLAQGFGPGMAARVQDGTNAAAAFVNILSVQALVPDAGYGAFGASQAAARSISQSLRAEFRASGLRVMNVYAGPGEDDPWFQPLPPPKVTPKALARSVVQGLVDGLEEVTCGDVARDVYARWQDNALLLERELTGAGA